MAALISASIVPVLAPLVAQLDAHRQTVERQAETIAELREARGRLGAELEATATEAIVLKVAQSRLEDRAAGWAEQVAVLREERARLTAELAAAQATVDTLRAAQAQQVGHQAAGASGLPPAPLAPWWKRWLLAVYG
jgi:chromosome segregation ATPase